MKYFLLSLFLIATSFTVLASNEVNSAGVVIYVNAAVRFSGDGSSWSSPYKYLQDALTEASGLSGSLEIRVAQGTYYPDEDTGGNYTDGDRNASFYMLNDVTITGGYLVSGSTAFRNWTQYPTILSGDINQNGTDNTNQIIRNDHTKDEQLTQSAVLSGFIIEASYGVPDHGGGIYNNFSSPLISECIFKNNRAYQGGAVKNIESSPVFKNCLFFDNISSFGGNAIKHEGGTLSLINCTLANNNNNADEGILSNGGTIIIKNSILWDNGIELNAVATTSPTYQVSYSIIEGGYAGIGNIDANPLFVSPASGNYQINLCSPAYNSGNNTANNSSTDLASNSRILYSTIDMGAYEFKTQRVYVKANATGNNDGTSWADAYNYLQDALASFEACGGAGEIWVAEGVYTTYQGIEGTLTDFHDASFKLLNNVKLYGGFLGYETLLSQRDYILYTSAITGDIQLNDGTGDLNDNSYHVFFNNYTAAAPLTNSAVLDGFTILGGNAVNPNAFIDKFGGGMYNKYASPIIANCQFRTNNALLSGAGMYNEYASPIISNSSFYRNISQKDAGGLFAAFGHLVVSNTNFIENKAATTNMNANVLGGVGGGMQLVSCTGSFVNCQFTENEAYIYGGGARIQSSTLTFSSTNFDTNLARSGGGVYATSSDLDLTDCDFVSNSANSGQSNTQAIYHGGGMFLESGEGTFTSCSFTENTTNNYGGGLYFSNTTAAVDNCSFNGNTAIYIGGADSGIILPFGGALFTEANAEVLVKNSTFKNNESSEGGGAIYNKSNDFSVYNSLFNNNVANLAIGAAIENNAASPAIINCTFVDLDKVPLATIRNGNASNPTIKNCIIWGKSTLAISNFNSSIPVVEKCIVKGGYSSGIEILNIDPRFKDSLNADYSLQRCSPGVDVGNNAFNSETIDLAGNSRIYVPANAMGKIDLGAYELQSSFQNNCNCPDNLNSSGYLSTYVYRASNSITSSAIVNPNQNVILGATNSITLSPPFETGSNVVFKAELEGCTSD